MIARSSAALGRTEEARAHYAEAIALLRSADPPAVESLARALNDQATLLQSTGDWATATSAFREAWELNREEAGDDHPSTAIIRGNVGYALLAQGQVDEADPWLRGALATLREVHGDEHDATGTLFTHVGTLEMWQGTLDQAEVNLRRGVQVLESVLPAGHWRVAEARLRLGRCLAELGKNDEAEPLVRAAFEVIDTYRERARADHDEAIWLLEYLYGQLDRPEEARRFRELRSAGG
jgi:tetratricopeptide (TPR) repeat protein